MKIKASTLTLALFLMSFATSQLVAAQTASGTYQFSLDDGFTKHIEFDARGQADGSATGQMTFSDEARLIRQDVDGTGEPEATYPGFYIKAEFDGLVVTGNRAVMSGTVRDSSVADLIGQRVLLTVEDNGDNTREPDKLTWGIYKPTERRWTPSDAEREVDEGVGRSWIATDAEQKDDRGIAMPRSEAIDPQRFPVSSYEFVEIRSGAGDITVRS